MSQDPLPGYDAWAPGAGYGTEMPTKPIHHPDPVTE
jgi:hypothetical protein